MVVIYIIYCIYIYYIYILYIYIYTAKCIYIYITNQTWWLKCETNVSCLPWKIGFNQSTIAIVHCKRGDLTMDKLDLTIKNLESNSGIFERIAWLMCHGIVVPMRLVLPTSMECKPPVLDGEVDVIGIKSWRTSHHIFVWGSGPSKHG